MKKFLWPCVIILGIALLLGGIAGFSKLIFGNRFDAEVAAMKAKGEPLTIAELLGDPVPDDRNAAVPFMEIDFRLQSANYDEVMKTLDGFVTPGAQRSEADWKTAEEALAKVGPLRLLVDKALARPECRFEVDLNDPVSTLFPQFPTLRTMANVNRISALVNAWNGRMDAAADDICTQAQMARILEEEPMLINHLVRMTFLSQAAKTVSEVADLGSLNERQARRVFDELGKMSISESGKRAWMGERTLALHYSDPKRIGRMLTAQSTIASVNPAAGDALYGTLSGVYGQTALKGDLAIYLRYTRTQLDCSGLSYREARSRGALEDPQDFPFYAVFTRMFCPLTSRLSVRRYQVEADVALAKALLAAMAYRDRYGAYPPSLGELESRLGWRLPKDPFSGGNLLYRPMGKGFIVYSVGPDLRDDGGRPCPNQSVRIDDKGDIVLTWEK